jgi:hypothetical protein
MSMNPATSEATITKKLRSHPRRFSFPRATAGRGEGSGVSSWIIGRRVDEMIE